MGDKSFHPHTSSNSPLATLPENRKPPCSRRGLPCRPVTQLQRPSDLSSCTITPASPSDGPNPSGGKGKTPRLPSSSQEEGEPQPPAPGLGVCAAGPGLGPYRGSLAAPLLLGALVSRGGWAACASISLPRPSTGEYMSGIGGLSPPGLPHRPPPQPLAPARVPNSHRGPVSLGWASAPPSRRADLQAGRAGRGAASVRTCRLAARPFRNEGTAGRRGHPARSRQPRLRAQTSPHPNRSWQLAGRSRRDGGDFIPGVCSAPGASPSF